MDLIDYMFLDGDFFPIRYGVGDKVRWTTGTHAQVTTKHGVIVATVEAGQHLEEVLEKLKAQQNIDFTMKARGGSAPRTMKSYLVLVAMPNKVKPKLYWPWPTLLSKE